MANSRMGERSIKKMKASICNCAGSSSTYHVLVLCFLLLSRLSAAGAADVTPVQDGARKIFIQRGQEQISAFTVKTAADGKAIQKGLAKSAPIRDDYGMLFILDKTGEHFFWMKGMEFGLDILFFDRDRRLIKILPNLLPCEECTKYKTPANTAYALEINAGMADVLGIKTGDILVFTKK